MLLGGAVVGGLHKFQGDAAVTQDHHASHVVELGVQGLRESLGQTESGLKEARGAVGRGGGVLEGGDLPPHFECLGW